MADYEIKNGIGIIPEGTTNMSSCAFSAKVNDNALELQSICIPDSVQEIGSLAFEGCKNLAKVEIPDSVKKIWGSAFKYCEKLSEIKLPKGLEKICDDTFNGCSSLNSVEIPETVETDSCHHSRRSHRNR